MSTSSINGRVSKTISLIMPLMGAGGLPVAQAQVTQVEAAGQVDSCRIAVSAGIACWANAHWLLLRGRVHAVGSACVGLLCSETWT
jgi:hypothetical protein